MLFSNGRLSSFKTFPKELFTWYSEFLGHVILKTFNFQNPTLFPVEQPCEPLVTCSTPTLDLLPTSQYFQIRPISKIVCTVDRYTSLLWILKKLFKTMWSTCSIFHYTSHHFTNPCVYIPKLYYKSRMQDMHQDSLQNISNSFTTHYTFVKITWMLTTLDFSTLAATRSDLLKSNTSGHKTPFTLYLNEMSTCSPSSPFQKSLFSLSTYTLLLVRSTVTFEQAQGIWSLYPFNSNSLLHVA